MRVLRYGFAAMAGLGMAVTLAPVADAQTPQRGGTAIMALNGEPTSLNPDISTNVPDRMVGCVVYQGLLEVSNDYKILPLLAKTWSGSPDGLTYSFELNKAEWHDGKPFTSEDVKYTLPEVAAKFSAIFAPAGRAIDTIETPAPDKVVIKLKQPFGPFLISLGCIQGSAIMPAHVFRGTNPQTNPATTTASMGTGSFKFVKWQHGDRIDLVKNEKYWEPGRPYLDAIVGKIILNAAARTAALRAGEVDFVHFMAASDKQAVETDPKLKVVESDVAPEVSLGFINVTHKPLDDKRVRQALFMAIDREYLWKNAFFGVGKVGVAPFSTDMTWTTNPDIDYRKMYPFDIAKANALLDEAGVKRGADGKRFKVKIVTRATQYTEFHQASIAIKSMWAQLGVDADIALLEDAIFAKATYIDGDFDMMLNVYTSYSDPALGVARTFVSSAIAKPNGNSTRYGNPAVDALFDKGEAATKLEDRGVFYKQAQTILAEDLPVFTLRQYKEIAGASKRLQGLWGVAQGNGQWTQAWLEK